MATGPALQNAELVREIEALRTKLAHAESQLAEAQDVIRAIQSGEVDALVVSGSEGEQVFTLKDAEYTYRALVEAMNEGAATLADDGTVLYCNHRLSLLVGIPLEQMIGSPVASLFSSEHAQAFASLLKRALDGKAEQAELQLKGLDGSVIPALVSLREMKVDEPAALCMVVTDLREQKKREEVVAAGRLATTILESAAEAIAVCDETGKIISGNEALQKLCGLNPLFQPFDSALPLRISDDGRNDQEFAIASALAGAIHRSVQVTYQRKNGESVPLLLSAGRIAGASGIAGCVLTFSDITEQKESEKKLRKLNRALVASSKSNQAMSRAASESELLQQVCKIITEDCGHSMVWIGFAEDDEHKSVRPVAYSGFEEGYLETLKVTWADNERGRGPTGMAIRTGHPHSCRNMLTDPKFEPWRAEALRRGYASSLVLPLMQEDKAFGAITIYSREPDPFLEDEVRLLVGLTNDLSHGIQNLRVRTARDRAERELREKQEWLRVTLASIGDAVLATDITGRVTLLNPVAAELTGWNEEDAKGQLASKIFRVINEHTRTPADDIVERVLREKSVVKLAKHAALLSKGGRQILVEDSAAPIRDIAGNVIGAVLVFQDVTEKRKAEAALRLSQEKFQKIFAGNPAAIALTRLEDGLFIEVNDTWVALLGYSRKEAIGQFAREMNIWPSHESSTRFVRELQQNGHLSSWEQEFKNKAGEFFTTQLSAQILSVGDEKLILSTFVDITARKRAEAEVRASEEQLRALGDNLPDSVVYQYTYQADGVPHFLYVSAGVTRLNGVTVAEVLQDAGTLHRQILPEDLPEFMKAETISARDLKVFERDARMCLPNGQIRWMRFRSQPHRLPDGRVIWDGVQTDITAHKQHEEALRESESRFRALFESSPDAVFLTIADGRVLAANPSACSMFGMSEAEMCRVGLQGLVDPTDTRFAAAEEERLRTKRLVKAELNFVRANGERFTAEVDSVILSNDSGHSFVILRDVTNRKRAEQALIQSEKLASVGRMASTIAHEINNPLETIGHVIYLAAHDPGTSEQAKSYIEMATQELERVRHITRQTLAFHRDSSTPSAIDLREILDDAMKLFSPRLQARGIAVDKRYAEVGRIIGVASEIRQVLANLLSNSMDAMPKQGKLRFHISRAMDKTGRPGVRLSIADTGSGIAPKQLKRIFEAFYTTKEVVGTGLGLWVTKQIVENHKASIRVRSKTGDGTVFSIVFPDADRQTGTP